ncbi:MAG: TauD/TfdA family dioxygenase [Gammaproteobacteria bacterium]|nr:TauD/TfdA family dioxygenase [Gammaproteobacteria bacterium]MCP5202502.1 TauD/TfdA family dioxygenase [Gammaproteobacteria bacterium]
MNVTVMPLTETFAAEVGDVDLGAPLDATAFAAIADAFARYAVLVFPGQRLDEEAQLAFARRFGPIEPNFLAVNSEQKFRVTPELIDISNLTPEGAIWEADSRMREFYVGNQLWHTDSSFKRVPAKASLLYARAVAPLGGHTEFADLRAAYDALPAATQARIAGLVAEHDIAVSRARTGFAEFTAAERAALPPVPQVLVRTVPESGRRSLYLAAHAGRILGLPEAAGRALLDELMAHATRREFVYTHRWRVGDLVLWDNRCTMHRGTPFDDQRHVRDMLRATVADVANSCEQEGVVAAS